MKHCILSLSLLISTIALHAADNNGDQIIKDYKPTHAPVVKMVSMRSKSPISAQLLKDEISSCTVPVIRQRMQNATRGIGEQQEGRMCPKIIWLTITRRFHQLNTDDLTKTIFDIVSKNESQKDFIAEPSEITNGPTKYMYRLATPRNIDLFTHYEKIKNPDNTFSIECTTRLGSKEYIEEIIAEMTHNS